MELLTAQDLARLLKITVDTVWRYTRTGRIPCVRLSDRDYRYRLDDVLASLSAVSLETIHRPPGNELQERPGLRKTDSENLKIFAGRTEGGAG